MFPLTGWVIDLVDPEWSGAQDSAEARRFELLGASFSSPVGLANRYHRPLGHASNRIVSERLPPLTIPGLFGGIRTPDFRVRSAALYPLSYEEMFNA